MGEWEEEREGGGGQMPGLTARGDLSTDPCGGALGLALLLQWDSPERRRVAQVAQEKGKPKVKVAGGNLGAGP